MVEFHENYELNHNTTELKRFKAIVSLIKKYCFTMKSCESDCAYL